MTSKVAQDAKDVKSARKFLWILMLIPIGLGAGVVMSNINFRKKENERSDIIQYRASQVFDRAAIEDDMRKIFLSEGEDSDYFLRHVSSTLGINNYLTIEPTQGYGANLGYYDIKGDDVAVITAVVVELDESNSVAKSALLAIPTAVIKSLAGEKGFANTLRFVFLPKQYAGNKRDIRRKGEELKSFYVLRAGGDFSINDDIEWRVEGEVWRHPAMAYPHESVNDRVTLGQVELALRAAGQFKKVIEAELQK